ncbi:MAG: hypothetical protein QNK23_10770 [Crocinitomicaceae bacterium]|nr:hypothetical protein [Crocinitomicaceae bacterium]
MGDYTGVFIIAYFIAHVPAFVAVGVGFAIRKSNPKTSKGFFIFAAVYFVVGGGICGSILS